MSGTQLPTESSALASPVNRGRYLLIAMLGVCAVALFVLATVSANTAIFAEHYRFLMILNGSIAALLAVFVGYQLVALRRRLKAGVFGARLTLRLVLLLSLMAVIPGAVIYGVSVMFLAKSIDSWFAVRVDKALEGGINLGRGVLENMLQDLRGKANAMAQQLSVRPTAEHPLAINTLREQANVQEATLFNIRGRVIAHSGDARAGVLPDPPSTEAMRQIRLRQVYAAIDDVPERGLVLRVIAPVNVIALNEELRVLQLFQPVPKHLAQDAEVVKTGYREYQELLLSRVGLKRLYGITLTLTLLLALLAALAAALLLSRELSAPLIALVEGTRAVAQGDYTRRASVASRDELGTLTESFNSMTRQLDDARQLTQRREAEVTQAKAYLESVLAHLSAGVLVFDKELTLSKANPSASHILGVDSALLHGIQVADWGSRESSLAVIAEQINAGFRTPDQVEWEQQVERKTSAGEQLLLLRGNPLPGGEDGFVVVFDDVTHLLQAQRDAAWSEVARRLAHEIKNPLTPIQLSAERMQLKLADKLNETDSGFLQRSTQTIVNQVAALKRMVDAFSQYARAPEPAMREIDLHALLREVLTLYESSASRIRLDLAPGNPRVFGDAGKLRQVIHNLLQNAQDAQAESANPTITVSTSIAQGAAENVCVTVVDNGSGFPPHLMKRAFEPYVTTKPKGTGLGLVIVKKIVEEHGGEVQISNIEPHGARVTITLPATAARSEPVRDNHADRSAA